LIVAQDTALRWAGPDINRIRALAEAVAISDTIEMVSTKNVLGLRCDVGKL